MKLQVNSKGSWRDVISFAADDAPQVREHAAALGRIAGKAAAWRIADDQNIALERCQAPDFKWVAA